MTDYLLKFPSKAIAEQFGIANGFSIIVDGVIKTTFASHEYAIHEIGEHNGANFWFLFRDLIEIPVPENAGQFIFWKSTSNTLRPTNDNAVPNVFWA